MNKVAIIGSRTFKNYQVLKNNLKQWHISEIISGGANGADILAEQYAREKNIKLSVFKPDYSKYGRIAPLKRNRLIIEVSDFVIAFWDGKSKGTKNAIDYANKLKKPVKIIEF